MIGFGITPKAMHCLLGSEKLLFPFLTSNDVGDAAGIDDELLDEMTQTDESAFEWKDADTESVEPPLDPAERASSSAEAGTPE
ncbi:MAG: hypothetical protein ACKV0T_10605 [Planctomycetales bacterium]